MFANVMVEEHMHVVMLAVNYWLAWISLQKHTLAFGEVPSKSDGRHSVLSIKWATHIRIIEASHILVVVNF